MVCSGETLLAPCARKRRYMKKMTEDCYWISTEENIGMFSKSLTDRNSSIYLPLFERQVRPMFNKLSYPRDDWQPFCELASTR